MVACGSRVGLRRYCPLLGEAGMTLTEDEFVGERGPICMLRESKNPVPTGRYGRDGDAVW